MLLSPDLASKELENVVSLTDLAGPKRGEESEYGGPDTTHMVQRSRPLSALFSRTAFQPAVPQ